MQYEPPMLMSTDDAEYYFQELRAQRQRAKQLFYCYLGEDDDPLEETEDDYYPYYEESAR